MGEKSDDEPVEYRTVSDRLRKQELLQMRFEREALAAVLDYFPIGIVILDADGVERHRNRTARILLGEVPEEPEEIDPNESAEDLREMLQQILRNSAGDDLAFHSLSLERASIRGAYHMLRVSLEKPVKSEGAGTVIFLSRAEQEREASPELLARIYRLTPAAAAVAARLITGLSPEEIATDLGIEVTTVRSHLRQLFDRTGTSRQTELVKRLLLGVSSLDIGGPRD